MYDLNIMLKSLEENNPYLLTAIVGGVTLASTQSPVVAFAAVCCSIFFFSARKKSPKVGIIKETADRLIDQGVCFISHSRRDNVLLGYDVDRRMLVINYPDGGDRTTIEKSIDQVRNVSWEIPGSNQMKTFGNVGFGAAMNVASHNIKDQLHVARQAGITFMLADIDRPRMKVNLDANQARMDKWLEIIQQAMAGTLVKPAQCVKF